MCTDERQVQHLIKKIVSRLFPVTKLHQTTAILHFNHTDNNLSRWLKEHSFQVTTIDNNTLEKTVNGGHQPETGSHPTLPFENNCFSLILMVETIEHTPKPYQLLRECARVLKPGGFLILSTPNIHSFASRMKSPILDMSLHEETSKDEPPNQHHSPVSISMLLYSFRKTNMTLVDLYTTGPKLSWFSRMLKSFINAFTFQMMKNFGRSQHHREYYLNYLSDRQLRKLIDATVLVVVARKES